MKKLAQGHGEVHAGRLSRKDRNGVLSDSESEFSPTSLLPSSVDWLLFPAI